ncbi:STAS domain-containing protein [Streptomyces sp. V4-01]|uniref:Anti-sigma factor antagonist n=1 Tax=Actinacidiphila polyblastidii TaxID=3110430 RepID=A0ABU7P3P9_9ACTN|nr:STAS domain-containing protein [Streptomyces sp. V4-01]
MYEDPEGGRFRIRREMTPAGVTVLTPASTLDFTTAPQLERAITVTGRLPCTVVDLSEVRFMDSSGINALIRAQRVARTAGGWIRLAGLQDHVSRTAEIAGLQDVVPVYPDRQAALRR